MEYGVLGLWLAICFTAGLFGFSRALRVRTRDLGPPSQRASPAIRALAARWFAVLTFTVIGWGYGAALGAQSLASLLHAQHLWDGVQLVASIGLEVLVMITFWNVRTLRTTVQGPLSTPSQDDEHI